MTDGYRALLDRIRAQSVSVDIVRQRLTGQLGVNVGDRLCFTLELLHQMVDETRTSEPRWHTCTVVVHDVRHAPDGTKVIVMRLPDDDPRARSFRTNPDRPRQSTFIDGLNTIGAV